MSSADSLAARLLSATLMFDRASLLALEALAAESDRRVLRRGEVLVHEGDPSDRFYVVLSGRFSVHKQDSTGPVAEIAQGELVGEIGFFAELPRTATVLAARDSLVLEISRSRFEKAAETLPGLREAVTTFLARRFATQSPSLSPRGIATIRTLAIVAAGGTRGIPSAFIKHLRQAFASIARARFVSRSDIEARFPGHPIDDQLILNWLNEAESKAEFIIYLADEEPTQWTRVCIRQADTIVFVADASCSPRLNRSEQLALSVHPPSTGRLVLLHQNRSAAVDGTSAWLNERPNVALHHHVALMDRSDVERVVRFISGNALGFVAAGGGSLGSAHLGVYKAFFEAGARFDYLGGTSSGAAMMAGLAMGSDPEQSRPRRGQHIHQEPGVSPSHLPAFRSFGPQSVRSSPSGGVRRRSD